MTDDNLDPSVDKEFVQKELEEVERKLAGKPGLTVVACCPLMVRVRFSRSAVKEMDVCLNFPPDYPSTLILMEAKSRTLPLKFTESVPLAFEKEKENYVGKAQILPALKFAKNFLEANSLAYCVQEICNLKKQLGAESEGSHVRVKQKQSAINLRVESSGYFIDCRLSVPEEYPAKQVELELKDSNFPTLFRVFFFHQAKELGRQAVQPPLLRRKKGQKAPPPPPTNFQPRPSLETVGSFLISNAQRYPTEPCAICKERCFPPDPADVNEEYESASHVERVYCGHIFHFSCIDLYMKTPPFKGGKACPGCKSIIYHDKWKDSEKTREDRWAHKEAKERELEEVADFLA